MAPSTERAQKHRRNLIEQGGKRIPIELDKQTLAVLERLVADRKMTKRSLIQELIHAEAKRTSA
jgi:predicted DNA-binding ribbon-helix-helix protein